MTTKKSRAPTALRINTDTPTLPSLKSNDFIAKKCQIPLIEYDQKYIAVDDRVLITGVQLG